MFTCAHHFNQSLAKWNVEKVTDIAGMFAKTYRFNQSLGNWNIA
jgi:hypothetical protein